MHSGQTILTEEKKNKKKLQSYRKSPTSDLFHHSSAPLIKPTATQLLLALRHSVHTFNHAFPATLLHCLCVLPPLQPGGRSNWSRLSCCPATYGSQPWRCKTKLGGHHRSRLTSWVRLRKYTVDCLHRSDWSQSAPWRTGPISSLKITEYWM